MIGVIAKPAEHTAVREFFELFKTPWEFYRGDRRYAVLLCAGDGGFYGTTEKLVLVYAGEKTRFDAAGKIQIDSRRKSTTLSYKGSRIPIYGTSVTFRDKGSGVLFEEHSGQPAALLGRSGGRRLARIGYDLFREVQILLTAGQPVAHAGIPTLEMHIALLRDLIVGAAAPLVEIPPVPEGYRFIACLTHDVDHPSIRQHKWDHTMFGFLYRAVLGTTINVFRGRASARTLFTNWWAAATLPLVHLGLAKDFWYEFDRYLEIERDLGSTFFVIPFKERPGRTARGEAPAIRASRYDPSDIAGHIRKFTAAGCEIGVHGIDAWLDSSKGREELEQVFRMTGAPEIGVRMHWLYGDEGSPVTLERAGFSYDSTLGYNETIGYRAGTTQVFRPLEATRLLELPLHVMDTALFYPCYLDLSPSEARRRVGGLMDNALRFGGTVTVNWHDRSIAPERLWDEFYVNLIGELKSRRPWFATAARAVAWFRKRRSAVFQTTDWESGRLRATVPGDGFGDLPGLRLRIYKAREPRGIDPIAANTSEGYVEAAWNDSVDTRVPV